MRRIKIPPQDYALKTQGGLCARGAYLRDTTVNTVCLVHSDQFSANMVETQYSASNMTRLTEAHPTYQHI